MVDCDAKVKLLIVDGEILLANDIANKLCDNNYDIIGTADTANKALELLAINQDTDLVLIDIMLKGEFDGIELASFINDKYSIPFIFLTFQEDNCTIDRAKSVKPQAYLLKPFNERQVSIAIELALMNFSNKISENEMLEKRYIELTENQALDIKDSLFLKRNYRFEEVRLEDILFFKEETNYCSVYTKSGLYHYSVDLNKLEEQLPTKLFMRVHRSYVVNINAVSGFEGNSLYIFNNKIPVSKQYQEDVFRVFKSI